MKALSVIGALLALPVLAAQIDYASYFGGSAFDIATAVGVDREGNVYLAGRFGSEGRLAKFDPTGTNLLFSLTLGASVDDIKVTSNFVYAIGQTGDAGFPATTVIANGEMDAANLFVAWISSTGSLVHGTVIGGNAADYATALDVDDDGNVVCAGYTYSSNFPTRNAYQPTQPFFRFTDTVLFTLDGSGTDLVFSTYLGGQSEDLAHGVAFDGSGNFYVCGETQSGDLRVTNALQPVKDLGLDMFIGKFATTGGPPAFLTFYGGSGWDWDKALDVVVDAFGNPVIIGSTDSTNFPTTNALQTAYGGGAGSHPNVALVKLNASGTARLMSSYLGGPGGGEGRRICRDALGYLHFAGSLDPNTPGLPSSSTAGGVFFGRLSPDLSRIESATYWGGEATCWATDIAVSSKGRIWTCGCTREGLFSVTNAYQGTHGGGVADMVLVRALDGNPLTRLAMAPTGGTEVTWESYVGADYRLQYTTNIWAGPWFNGSVWTGTGMVTTVEDPGLPFPPMERSFYRVERQP